jgi:release factor H-coupled RctB family protein
MNASTLLAESNVRLFASSSIWVEPEAIRQLYAAAQLDGVRCVAGFPHLQSGRSTPSGCAVVTDAHLHPTFLGGDIGCGLALFRTGLSRRAIELGDWSQARFDLEHPWEGDTGSCLARAGLSPGRFDGELGRLAEGNHFAEVLAVEKVRERMALAQLGLDAKELLALVHAGSGELGQSILEAHLEEHGGHGLAVESEAATRYLLQHDHAVRWAEVSRQLIAQRLLEPLGATATRVLDCPHNRVACRRHRSGQVWVHRKGAVASECGPVVIAGTRGSFSYLVQPCSDEELHAWSLAHGAGRKWSRSESRVRMRQRYTRADLEHTPLGGRVICENRDRLFDEAPAAFKDVEALSMRSCSMD